LRSFAAAETKNSGQHDKPKGTDRKSFSLANAINEGKPCPVEKVGVLHA